MVQTKKRLFCYILLFCIILSHITGCSAPFFRTQQNNAQEENGELTLSQDSPLNYTLTEEDYTQYKALLVQVKSAMLSAQTCEEAEAEMEKVSERIDYFRKQSKIAEILYYCNQNDKKKNDDYLYSCDILNKAYMDAVILEQEIYHANPPYRDEYFDGMTEEEVEEAVKEEKAERAYQDFQAEVNTQFYSMSEEELNKNAHTLYAKLLKQGRTVATENGYDSFYDYATENLYFRDFGKEERDSFRVYIKKYIVPLYKTAYQNFRTSFILLDQADQDKLIQLMDNGPYNSLDKNYLAAYIDSLPESLKKNMSHMFDNNYFICADWDGALEGALTTMIEDPFCYFGPGYYQTTFTMAHELGHYYATLFLNTEIYSFDIAETHSQGNEMLLLHFLKSEMDKDIYKTLVNFKIYSLSSEILLSATLDEFEETVFSDEKFETYTTEQFSLLIEQIAKDYQLPKELTTQLKALWKNVCITNPVYYISYATSGTAALNLYQLSTENIDTAMEAYRKTVEELNNESNFVETLKTAGLHTPFEEAAYKNLKDLIA